MINAVIEELKTHQTQLDQDGVMVGVSRQALEELLAHVAAPAHPAPIAGLEPVAWLMEWRTQPNSPMPKMTNRFILPPNLKPTPQSRCGQSGRRVHGLLTIGEYPRSITAI